MPKKTFYNLNYEKRASIEYVLKDEFSNKPFKDCNIKNIVERLSISRGSFYQYFEDLKDAYFYILDKETQDIHLLFISILNSNGHDIFKALDIFGIEVSNLIFSKSNYNIYKFKYLYWTNDLENSWKMKKKEYYNIFKTEDDLKKETIYFIKAIVHSLIERNFEECWSKDVFIKKYKLHINWLMKGVENENY